MIVLRTILAELNGQALASRKATLRNAARTNPNNAYLQTTADQNIAIRNSFTTNP